jgi:hypothetical protein
MVIYPVSHRKAVGILFYFLKKDSNFDKISLIQYFLISLKQFYMYMEMHMPEMYVGPPALILH